MFDGNFVRLFVVLYSETVLVSTLVILRFLLDDPEAVFGAGNDAVGASVAGFGADEAGTLTPIGAGT